MPYIPTADAEIGKELHKIFYGFLSGEKNLPENSELWKKVKEGRNLINSFEMRKDFSSPEELKLYYDSLKNHLILWKSEDEYLKKIEKGLKNSEEIAKSMRGANYESEKWMTCTIDNKILLRGRIDLASEDEIVDLKTGKESPWDREQMLFYSLLLYQQNGIIPKAKVIYIENGKMEEMKFTLDELMEFKQEVMDVVKGILNKDFTLHTRKSLPILPLQVNM